MATLKANGEVIAEIIARKTDTDGAEADPMEQTVIVTYRIMSSGYVLRRGDTISDYGTGGKPTKHAGGWKRFGKLRAALLRGGTREIRQAAGNWADNLRATGWDAKVDGI